MTSSDAAASDQPAPEYHRFVIEEVTPAGENLRINYGGRVFGGIVRCLLPGKDVEASILPGAEVYVRYHEPQTGQPGQIAHMLIRHPSGDGWAEIFSDMR